MDRSIFIKDIRSGSGFSDKKQSLIGINENMTLDSVRKSHSG